MKKFQSKLLKFWKEHGQSFIKDPLFLSKWVSPYYREKKRNKISVRVGSGGYKWVGHNYRGDLFMFIQDMYQGIMPFVHLQRQGSSFVVKLNPVMAEKEQLITEAFDRRGYRHDLTDALCDFIRSATHSLFVYGKIIYEIVYEKDEEGNLTSFEFANIYPLSVRKIFGNFFQIIPWWIAKHSHVKVGIYKIPKEKIVYIEFPKSLGGRRGLKKILSRLSILGKEIIPSFQMDVMKDNKNIGFDLNKYLKEKYLEKAQLTKTLGWRQRKIPDNEILEYYAMYRNLHYSLSQAIIREHILDAVNEALNGSLLDLGTKIVMEGVPNSSQIRSEFKALEVGDIEFMDLYKRTTVG